MIDSSSLGVLLARQWCLSTCLVSSRLALVCLDLATYLSQFQPSPLTICVFFLPHPELRITVPTVLALHGDEDAMRILHTRQWHPNPRPQFFSTRWLFGRSAELHIPRLHRLPPHA